MFKVKFDKIDLTKTFNNDVANKRISEEISNEIQTETNVKSKELSPTTLSQQNDFER